MTADLGAPRPLSPPEKLLGKTWTVAHIHPGPNGSDAAGRLPPHLVPILDIVVATAGGTIRDLVKRTRKSFGNDLAGFKNEYVSPALVARGLLALQPKRFLWVKSLTPTLTPAGEVESGRLTALMAQARESPRHPHDSPHLN